ncbi:MAG: tetraacyldisaccharide 4'-kinase [Bacteroidales bacterium]|nr:tetraacyldisaccharide 4'-kinase [Bacteroidales bacterium]
MKLIDKILLFPYYLTLKQRHRKYDSGRKKVATSPVKTICVGNITVGGTGKTPHTEMILRHLTQRDGEESVAVLSRGYKRRSKGFNEIEKIDAVLYGDEPCQIKRNFPSVVVAVDKIREHGCEEIHRLHPEVKTIILDDAFQYRALKADVNIVLVDYSRPIFDDHLLPLGRLRDLPERIAFADIVIVTKCPELSVEEEESEWRKKLHLREDQKLYFTSVEYMGLEKVFEDGDPHYKYARKAVCISAIASSKHFVNQIGKDYGIASSLSFPDHHSFSPKDIKKIEEIGKKYPLSIFITTQKDAVRLLGCPFSENIRKRLFALPIRARLLHNLEY